MKCKNYLNQSKNLLDFKNRLRSLVKNKNDSFENFMESFNASKLLRKIEGKTDLDELVKDDDSPNFNLSPEKMADLFGKT